MIDTDGGGTLDLNELVLAMDELALQSNSDEKYKLDKAAISGLLDDYGGAVHLIQQRQGDLRAEADASDAAIRCDRRRGAGRYVTGAIVDRIPRRGAPRRASRRLCAARSGPLLDARRGAVHS